MRKELITFSVSQFPVFSFNFSVSVSTFQFFYDFMIIVFVQLLL